MHILITEPIHQVAMDWLADRDVTTSLDYEGDDWRAVADQIDAVIVRSYKVTAAFLDELPHLKVVGKYGVGVNTVDLAACAARGVLVSNIPGANANSVAEHAVAMLTAVTRDLIVCDTTAREGRFEDRFGIRFMAELTDAKVGIFGGGRIGTRVAEICHRGYGCEIAVYDPFLAEGSMDDVNATQVETLAELFDFADYVVVAAPLTDQTRNSVGLEELSKLGPDGIIVCSSRGGIVDEAALAEAVKSGLIRGAALDVFSDEPPRPDNPLFGLPTVVVTPHVGGASEKSRQRMGIQLVEQLWELLNGREAHLVGQEAWL